jgi:cytochrome c oxidase subunit I+III
VLQWALFLVGSFVACGAMFALGASGMTGRVYIYPHAMPWDILNLIASIGAWTIGASFVVLLFNLARAYVGPAAAPANPWGASGLEWATPSPPRSTV